MADVPAEVEQQLASMTQGEWAAFSAKVRAPDTAEHVRSLASQVLSGPQLDAFVAVANPAVFVGSDGKVDETKVMGHLTAMYGTADPTPKSGAGGRAEAAKRFGGNQPQPAPASVAGALAGHTVQVPGAVQAEIEK